MGEVKRPNSDRRFTTNKPLPPKKKDTNKSDVQKSIDKSKKIV